MRKWPLDITSLPRALHLVYEDRRYRGAAVLLSLCLIGGLSWVAELVGYVPGRGLVWDGTPLRLLEVLLLAISLGLCAPMQVYVLRKERHHREGQGFPKRPSHVKVSRLFMHVRAPGMSGGIGIALGVVCLTCCAPLLLPGILVFGSWTGSVILALHAHLEMWSGWVFLGSVLLCVLTFFFVAQNVTAACALPQGNTPKGGKEMGEKHGEC